MGRVKSQEAISAQGEEWITFFESDQKGPPPKVPAKGVLYSAWRNQKSNSVLTYIMGKKGVTFLDRHILGGSVTEPTSVSGIKRPFDTTEEEEKEDSAIGFKKSKTIDPTMRDVSGKEEADEDEEKKIPSYYIPMGDTTIDVTRTEETDEVFVETDDTNNDGIILQYSRDFLQSEVPNIVTLGDKKIKVSDYKKIKWDVPMVNVIKPISTASLSKDMKFALTKVQVGNVLKARETRIARMYHLDTLKKGDPTFIYVSQKVKLGNKNPWLYKFKSKNILQLLQDITGKNAASMAKVFPEGTTDQFMAFHAYKGNLLTFYHEGIAMATGDRKSLQSSPSLFYILRQWAYAHKSKYKDEATCVSLLFFLVAEGIDKWFKNKATIKQIAQHASLIFEVITLIAGQGILSSFNHILGAILKDNGIKDMSGDEARRTMIPIYVSAEKALLKKRLESAVLVRTNIDPVVLEETQLYAFIDILSDRVTEKRKDAWAEAAILVEIATGARVREILRFSQFHTIEDLSKEEQKAYNDFVSRSVPAFKTMSYAGAIIQEGVLKKKKNNGPMEYSYTRMPPKPVILGLSPAAVKDLVYNVIRPALHDLLRKKKHTATHANFYEYDMNDFKQFNQQINDTINNLYPNAEMYVRKHGQRLTSHTFRKVYANWSFDEYGFRRMSRNAWITTVLGHDASSLGSSLSYTGAKFNRLLKFSDKATEVTEMKDEIVTQLKDYISGELEKKHSDVIELFRDDDRIRHISRENRGVALVDAYLLDASLPEDGVAFKKKIEIPKHERVRVHTDDERADAVLQYFEEFMDSVTVDGHDYTVIPTNSALAHAGFGKNYIKAFRTKFKKTIADLQEMKHLIEQERLDYAESLKN